MTPRKAKRCLRSRRVTPRDRERFDADGATVLVGDQSRLVTQEYAEAYPGLVVHDFEGRAYRKFCPCCGRGYLKSV